jgi:hypothetical protein
MTTITDPLSAASVGAVVRRAGYPTGYRYAQTGYTHRGQPITQTGCEVTRVAGNARRGLYDAGEVRVFVIQPRDLTTYEQRDLAVEKIAAALAEAFPGREVVKTPDMVSVSDTVESRIVASDVRLYDVMLTVAYEGADERDAADRFLADYVLPSMHDRVVTTVQRADGRGEPVTLGMSAGDEQADA